MRCMVTPWKSPAWLKLTRVHGQHEGPAAVAGVQTHHAVSYPGLYATKILLWGPAIVVGACHCGGGPPLWWGQQVGAQPAGTITPPAAHAHWRYSRVPPSCMGCGVCTLAPRFPCGRVPCGAAVGTFRSPLTWAVPAWHAAHAPCMYCGISGAALIRSSWS